jgi:hypothetical protein
MDKPAIIRNARSQIITTIKTLAGKSKETNRAIGLALLDLKKECSGHGEFSSALRECKIGRSTAYWLMDKASSSSQENELFKLDASPEDDELEEVTTDSEEPSKSNLGRLDDSSAGESQAETETVVDNPPPKPTSAQHSPYPPEKRCRKCRIYKLDKPRCKDCDEHNREPGDDSDIEANAKKAEKENPNGKPVFVKQEWEKTIAEPMRYIDRVARCYGLLDARGAIKQTPEIQGFHRRLEELRAEVVEWNKKLAKEKRS